MPTKDSADVPDPFLELELLEPIERVCDKRGAVELTGIYQPIGERADGLLIEHVLERFGQGNPRYG